MSMGIVRGAGGDGFGSDSPSRGGIKSSRSKLGRSPIPSAPLMNGPPAGSANNSTASIPPITSVSSTLLVSRPIISSTRHPLMNTWTFWYLHRSLPQRFRARDGDTGGSGNGHSRGIPDSEETANLMTDLGRDSSAPVRTTVKKQTMDEFEYEKEIMKLSSFGTLEDFWSIYSHLRRPDQLEPVSDLHLFRAGVRPIWEDQANAKGGKWILRLKKGLSARLWEQLVFMTIADQADLPADEICGLVLSVRGNEDVISIWNKTCDRRPSKSAGYGYDGGETSLKVKEAIIQALQLPQSTVLSYKQHDDSIRDRRGV